ncbi:hypothetical protein ACFSMW_14015 [Virgibacillus halophilus]
MDKTDQVVQKMQTPIRQCILHLTGNIKNAAYAKMIANAVAVNNFPAKTEKRKNKVFHSFCLQSKKLYNH